MLGEDGVGLDEGSGGLGDGRSGDGDGGGALNTNYLLVFVRLFTVRLGCPV